ncbi:MAG TPA: hypothetical protein VKA98_05950 [Nitrososphaeraceae archaeon]|nr:hypothetical protein [Nitrososphaeraceae archaeon]
MNKKNQRIEVNLSVIAISAILVAALFVMGSSRFITDAMAQNFTDQTGAAAGGAANQTGAAAGGAANQSGMVMIPQAAMATMMDNIETVRGAVDEGDTEANDALDNVEMQLRTAAGLPPAATETADEGDTDTDTAADEEDTDTGGDTDTDEEDTDTDEEDTDTEAGGGGGG